LIMALAFIAALPVFQSCLAGQQKEADGTSTYTMKVDSDSVGTQFGPVQFEIGNTYLGQKQYAEAVKAYTAAINNGYTKNEVYVNRGSAYLALGLFSGAIADASLSLDMSPSEAKAFEVRGKAYLESGEYRKAEEDFSKAINLAPGNKEDYYGRGMARINLTRCQEAISDFGTAIEINPKYSDAYFGRAQVNDRYTQDYDAALKDYTKVVDLKGAYAHDALNNRGMVYFKLNEYGEAISDYSQLLELAPDYWIAYYNRGTCYAAIKRYSNAVTDYKTYLQFDVSNKYEAVPSADYLVSYYKPFLEGYTH
jgi:tetratricopeptide (TPR) repeat protein